MAGESGQDEVKIMKDPQSDGRMTRQRKRKSYRQERALIERVLKRHRQSKTVTAGWRKMGTKCYSYYESRQIPSDLPEDVAYLVVNLIRGKLDTKSGILLAAKPTAAVKGREIGDSAAAAAFGYLQQYSLDADYWESKIQVAVEDLLKCGMGLIVDEFSLEKRQLTKNGWVYGDLSLYNEDPLNVYIDPANRTHEMWGKNGPQFYSVETEVNAELLMMSYPKLRRKLGDLAMGSSESKTQAPPPEATDYGTTSASDTSSTSDDEPGQGPQSDDTIPVLVHFYLVYNPIQYVMSLDSDGFPEKIVFVPDPDNVEWIEAQRVATESGQVPSPDGFPTIPMTPDMIPEEQEDMYEVITIPEKSVRTCAIARESVLIYDKPCPYKHKMWPHTFFCGTMNHNDPMPHGEVERLVDLQDAVNKMGSLILEHAMRSTRSNTYYEEGAFADPEEETRFRKDRNLPGATFKMALGAIDKVKDIVQSPLPEAFYRLQDSFRVVMDEVFALYQTQRGGMPYDTSGRAIIALQKAGDTSLVNLKGHIEYAITQLGRKRLSNIQQFYTHERSYRITSKLKDVEEHLTTELQYNDEAQKPTLHMFKVTEGIPEPVEVLKDVSIGEYDIIYTLGTGLERDEDQRMKRAEMVYNATQDVEFLLDELEVEQKDQILRRMQERTQGAAAASRGAPPPGGAPSPDQGGAPPVGGVPVPGVAGEPAPGAEAVVPPPISPAVPMPV